ncbi:MAG: purine-nucleoside phosphorylase [Balneolales bacterium]|nr:purine-nucleoside phosphorylase [Balneolales bacterium]
MDLSETKAYLIERGFTEKVDAAVILGSGLGGFAATVSNAISVPYNEIPGFPEVTVAGHGGDLIQGIVGKKRVLVYSGRFHHYEGHPLERTVIPVRVAHTFEASSLIVSNAAGSINTRFSVGDLMLIDDFMRVGFKSSTGTELAGSRYDNRKEIALAHKAGLDLGIQLRQGTYLFVKGPVYETAAEIRAFRYMGADAVGMSTVPELLEAQKLGINSLGITLITNMSTGVTKAKLEHGEIKEVADSRKDDFGRLVTEILQRI